MKLLVIAGPPSAGKTALTKQIVKNFQSQLRIAYLKIDVVKAYEDIELKKEFSILTRKVYSGDLCPDHASVMVLGDVIDWAEENKADLLIVESAGLCLRCSPYLNQGLGVVVLSSISGIHTPEKMGAMVSLADVAVVTKIDLVSQAEREVFIQKISEIHPSGIVMETNALQGTSLHRLYNLIVNSEDITPDQLMLKGSPPIGTCTICVGKKEIGWKNHFGVVKRLDGPIADYLYRGE
ncbi:Ni2+-binding GTPase involved in maturation of urease and hydrogenase [Heliophilum fasciatum]|uniref:Ni2+-binding GTPase involved in maturation of urease and hydrogenase n=1 Tax=Heliophilum fasciatum TaxID=35700 RepID=A0A4R2S0M8_9FIRM|nr:GTP-binding protein [Heliophilum fasciatum]MCW2276649.1 Ni2+-binding GTPase involved in maturation of urease and hydrogenase [Heliophilum fasciatum]TCP68969.1 Ni2+-binding GTPase involved in maturation of urease and hydrogenase [Heliophilum fasciatum]